MTLKKTIKTYLVKGLTFTCLAANLVPGSAVAAHVPTGASKLKQEKFEEAPARSDCLQGESLRVATQSITQQRAEIQAAKQKIDQLTADVKNAKTWRNGNGVATVVLGATLFGAFLASQEFHYQSLASTHYGEAMALLTRSIQMVKVGMGVGLVASGTGAAYFIKAEEAQTLILRLNESSAELEAQTQALARAQAKLSCK
jgi:DNA repair exonuclease SbcCD ATPase subunit